MSFIDEYDWKEVTRSVVWRPSVGAVKAGIFRGFAVRHGKFGEYMVALVYTPDEDTLYSASGAQLIGALEFVPEGTPVKLIYDGKVQVKSAEDRWYKKFTVAIGAKVAVSET